MAANIKKALSTTICAQYFSTILNNPLKYLLKNTTTTLRIVQMFSLSYYLSIYLKDLVEGCGEESRLMLLMGWAGWMRG
jgi:hypothetical protein